MTINSKFLIIKNIAGLTFIELMISLTLSILILMSVTTVYLITAQNQNFAEALLSIQENLRIFNHVMNSAIRNAGYMGCQKISDKVMPYHDVNMKLDTDGITIRKADVQNVFLQQPMQDYITLYLSKYPVFKKNDTLIIANCHSAEIFTVNDVSIVNDWQKIITSGLVNKYDIDAQVSLLQEDSYFIKKSNRLDENGLPIYSLYKKNISGESNELIAGINSMKISYFLLSNNKLIPYQSNQIIDDSKVKGLSINVEFASLNHYPLIKKEYLFIALRES